MTGGVARRQILPRPPVVYLIHRPPPPEVMVGQRLDAVAWRSWRRREVAIAREGLAAGAQIVQLRLGGLPAWAQLDMGAALGETARAWGAILIVNDRADLALALDAAGVHVGAEDLPIEATRAVVGAGRLVGATVRGPEGARRAVDRGADILGLGPIGRTSTKRLAVEPLGPRAVAACRQGVRDEAAIYAIGGIDVDLAAACVAAGADGVAVVSSVFDAPSPGRAVERLLRAMGSALRWW